MISDLIGSLPVGGKWLGWALRDSNEAVSMNNLLIPDLPPADIFDESFILQCRLNTNTDIDETPEEDVKDIMEPFEWSEKMLKDSYY